MTRARHMHPHTFVVATHPSRTKYPPINGERLTWNDALRRIWAKPDSRHTANRAARALALGFEIVDGVVEVVDSTGEVVSGHAIAAAHIALQLPVPVAYVGRHERNTDMTAPTPADPTEVPTARRANASPWAAYASGEWFKLDVLADPVITGSRALDYLGAGRVTYVEYAVECMVGHLREAAPAGCSATTLRMATPVPIDTATAALAALLGDPRVVSTVVDGERRYELIEAAPAT